MELKDFFARNKKNIQEHNWDKVYSSAYATLDDDQLDTFTTKLWSIDIHPEEFFKSIPDGFAMNLDGISSFENKNTITDIGVKAFYGCKNLKSVKLNNIEEGIEKKAFANTGLETVSVSNCAAIGDSAFADNRNLTEVTLDNVFTIRAGAFMNCPNLKTVTLTNVGRLRGNSFEGCNNVEFTYTDDMSKSALAYAGLI